MEQSRVTSQLGSRSFQHSYLSEKVIFFEKSGRVVLVNHLKLYWRQKKNDLISSQNSERVVIRHDYYSYSPYLSADKLPKAAHLNCDCIKYISSTLKIFRNITE